MIIRRHLTSSLLEALADTPVVLLHGARQTGKSTLVQELAKGDHEARYLTLDDATLLAAASRDPAGFLAGLDGSVILDEVQRVPELFLALKAEVDRDRRPGRFLLTGSADVLLLPRLAEVLTGRMEILTLWPLAQSEIEGRSPGLVDWLFSDAKPPFVDSRCERDDVLRRVLAGGYPEMVLRETDRRRKAWLASYTTTLVQREVQDLANIDGLNQIPRLLSLLAARATSLLNYAELSRTIDLPQTSLKRYLGLLEATFLFQTLPAWSAHLGKRLVRSPKVLLIDSGLLGFLQGADLRRFAREPQLAGPLLENFVDMEILKEGSWSELRPRLYHFRTQTRQEVDLVLEDAAGRLVGIESKASGSLSGSDFKGLTALAELAGERFHRGIVFYLGRAAVPFGDNLHALPVEALWSWPASGA